MPYEHPPLDLPRPVTEGELCVNLFKALAAFVLFEYFTVCICIILHSWRVLGFLPQNTDNSKVITARIPFRPRREEVAVCHVHLHA